MRVSYSQLTELTGKSYRALKRLLDGLEPVGTGPTKANLWESKDALPLIYCPPATENTDGLDLNTERARESKERADKLELENAVRRKELLPAESVKRVWATHITNAKTKLEGLPSKLAAMATEPDEARRFFVEARDIVHQVLNELGRGAA